jgi:hypothetical protein
MNTNGVVTVGGGRGFILEHRVYFDFGEGWRKIRRKVVATASHCLPEPPRMPCFSYQETTFAKLLAPLGEEPSIWVDCLFFDPVADIAILGEPDNQVLGEEWDAYNALVDKRRPFALAPPETGEGYMLALDGVTWKPTAMKVHVTIGGLGLSIGPTISGQSGSPILNARGQAVALVSKGGASNGVPNDLNGGQPILRLTLPPWLTRASKTMKKICRNGLEIK